MSNKEIAVDGVGSIAGMLVVALLCMLPAVGAFAIVEQLFVKFPVYAREPSIAGHIAAFYSLFVPAGAGEWFKSLPRVATKYTSAIFDNFNFKWAIIYFVVGWLLVIGLIAGYIQLVYAAARVYRYFPYLLTAVYWGGFLFVASFAYVLIHFN